METKDLNPKDYKYVLSKPDPNFSPKRNQMVIDEVIRSGEMYDKALRVAQRKDTEDRIDILSSYARHSLGSGTKKLEDFVGREWMKKIYGEKIIQKLRIAESVKRLNIQKGNTKFLNYDLT